METKTLGKALDSTAHAAQWMFWQFFLFILAVLAVGTLIQKFNAPVHAQTPLSFGNIPAEQLALSIDLPKSVPVASAIKVPEHKTVLAEACESEEKCICINNAIFKHDSSWATAGVGAKTNNPCNMRIPKTWKPSVKVSTYYSPGNGSFARFDTLADGITACVELYKRNYSKLPPDTLVTRWTSGDNNREYLTAVYNCFL